MALDLRLVVTGGLQCIQKDLASLSYVSVDDVIAEVVRRGRGTLLAKMDVKQAYRNIPVHPRDRYAVEYGTSVWPAFSTVAGHRSCRCPAMGDGA